MKVPNEEAFTVFIERCNVTGTSTLSPEEVGLDNLHEVSSYLAAVDKLRIQTGDGLGKTEVGNWLQGNPTSERAWSSLYGRRKVNEKAEPLDAASQLIARATLPKTREDFERYSSQSHRVSSLTFSQFLEQENSQFQQKKRLVRALKFRADWNPYQTTSSIAHAFKNYFYSPSLSAFSVSPKDAREAASKLLDAYHSLIDDEIWRRAGVDSARPLLRANLLYELQLASGRGHCPVVRKLDETARERVLAFELWWCFKRAYRSNKTTSIYNFMQFEGVVCAPDIRSIERWIADWKRRKVRNPSHPQPIRTRV